MIHINIPIVVEGKYDKARLSGVTDAVIITTNGFSIFNDREKQSLLRRLGERGLVVLCDSDGGGRTIRSHLKGFLDGITVYNLYVPQIKGVERRKKTPSKEGLLGVEGISADTLSDILEKFAKAHPEFSEVTNDRTAGGAADESSCRKSVTKAFMYSLGLTGGEGAAKLRDALCAELGLPRGMNANNLCEALGLISDAFEVESAVSRIKERADFSAEHEK